MTKPVRIQRKRTRGWKMPPNTVYVGRASGLVGARSFANPFRVGGYFKIGRGEGHGSFAWLEAHKDYADASFNLIETKEQAVGFFTLYRRLYPFTAKELEPLRGKNLCCWCALCPSHIAGKPFDLCCDDCSPCHCDPLGQIANAPLPSALAGTQTTDQLPLAHGKTRSENAGAP